MSRISLFHGLGCPILLGASRKGFVGRVGGVPDAAKRGPGSAGLALWAVSQGVQFLRVHDIDMHRQAIALWRAVRRPEEAAARRRRTTANGKGRAHGTETFGTDGVRGRANSHPMTADMAMRLGAAAGRFFRRDDSAQHRVVIGKDTRLSGYMLENALTAGFTSTGMNVLLLGPVPTPAVGLLTPSMRADVGVMISASHNPAEDNGIKFFGPDGYKLSDAAEEEIEALLEAGVTPAQARNIGRAKRIDDGRFRYVERVKGTFPAGLNLKGLRWCSIAPTAPPTAPRRRCCGSWAPR
jgi:hypothetical protein